LVLLQDYITMHGPLKVELENGQLKVGAN